MPRAWRLCARPAGVPTLEHFELVDLDLPALAEGEVMVRNDWLSVDPYMRSRMSVGKNHFTPYELHQPMAGGGIGTVVESRSDQYPVGQRVQHLLGWREVSVGPARDFKKIPPLPAPEQLVLHHLGIIGFSAYVGLLHVMEAKAGETIFISAAGGSVGSAAVQIAKILRLRVIGSAGGPEKCRMVEELGADMVLDYKAPGPMFEKLQAAAPDGIDLYFDNVGGDHLDAALGCAKMHARFALCGMVSAYNEDNAAAMVLSNIMQAVWRRIRLGGFIAGDYLVHFDDFRDDMIRWIQDGRIRSPVTVRYGIESAPLAFLELFAGTAMGKMLVRL